MVPTRVVGASKPTTTIPSSCNAQNRLTGERRIQGVIILLLILYSRTFGTTKVFGWRNLPSRRITIVFNESNNHNNNHTDDNHQRPKANLLRPACGKVTIRRTLTTTTTTIILNISPRTTRRRKKAQRRRRHPRRRQRRAVGSLVRLER